MNSWEGKPYINTQCIEPFADNLRQELLSGKHFEISIYSARCSAILRQKVKAAHAPCFDTSRGVAETHCDFLELLYGFLQGSYINIYFILKIPRTKFMEFPILHQKLDGKAFKKVFVLHTVAIFESGKPIEN